MATISQVQEVIYRARFEDQASQAAAAAAKQVDGYNAALSNVDQTVTRSTKSASALINQFDAQTKSTKALQRAKQDLASAEVALAQDAATGGAKQDALGRVVDTLRDKVAASTKTVADGGDAAKKSGDAHAAAGASVGLFGLNAQKTGFLVHDATKAIESLTLGMSPLQVAMQHVGQVQGIFGSLGDAVKSIGASFVSVPGAILAVTAALGAMGVAAQSEFNRMANLREQLRATHDDYASLATSVDAAAKSISASTALSTADARAATQTIASAKLFSGTQQDIVELTKLSQDLARVWNTDVATSAKFLADALNDPAKAANDLAQKGFPGMTLELAHTIANLQTAGQSGQAFSQVMSVLSSGTRGATQDQSALSKALHDLGQTFTAARDGGKSLSQSIGDLIDSFLALQVRGLNNLITTLDTYISKMQQAISLKNLGNTATQTGGGGVDDLGRPYLSTTSSSGQQVLLGPTIKGTTERAAGIFQVLPSTGKELGYDVNDPTQNVQAGLSYLQKLYSNTGSVDSALSRYGGYGTNVTNAQGYISNVLGQNSASLPTTVSGQIDYWGNVLGMSPGMIEIGKKLAVVESGGRQYTTGDTDFGRGGASYSGTLGGTGLNANTTTGLMTGGYDVLSNPNGSLSTAVRNNNLATSQNAFGIAQSVNPLSSQIEAATKEISGLQAGLDLATKSGDTDEIKRLTDALAAAKGRATDLITEQQKLARASQDAVAPLSAQEGATRTLALVQQQFVQAARSSGTSVDQAALATALADKLRELAVAFNDTVSATDRQTAATQRIVASFDGGAASVIAATNREKALAQARDDFLPGPDQDAAVDRYTAALNRQSAAAADLATKQKSFDQRDQLQVLQLETQTLGENSDQRDKEIALLKEKQALIKAGADIQSAASQADLANVAAIQDATAAYRQQQGALSELSNFVTNTFDTISNSITSAFANGSLAALKFKDIANSVVSALVSEFLKLSVINPLKNLVTGGTDQTLSSVLGFLGGGSTSSIGSSSSGSGVSAVSALLGLGGASAFNGAGTTLDASGNVKTTSSSSSTDTLSAAGSIGSLLSKVGGIKELGQLLSGNYTGSGLGIVGQVGSINLYSSGSTVGQTVSGAAADDFATVGGATTSAGTSAGISVTVGQALGVIGGLYSAYSGFERGGVGGTIGGAAGLAGAGLAVASTGALGAGAAGLAAAAGPYAPIALAAIAVISAFLPGAHPLNSYQGTEVMTQDGHVVAGKTVSQVQSSDAAVSQINQFGTALDTYMSQVGIQLTNLNGTLGDVGTGIKGLTQYSSVTDPAIFSKLQFTGDPNDTSNFGVAKGALTDMTFNSIDELSTELVKIAGFADAASAMGIQLSHVAKDISNIQIASVSGGNANALGSVTDASGNVVQYHNDLRTALNADLPGQTFADTTALDTEIAKVNTFVNTTVPQLLTPIEQTSSSITTAVDNIAKTYGDAINQSEQYGLDNTAVLLKAEQDAIGIVRRTALMSLTQNQTSIVNRFLVATNDNVYTQQQKTLDDLLATQANEIETYTKSWTDIFGDGVKSSAVFQAALGTLVNTLGAEYSTKLAATNKAIQAQYDSLWQSFQSTYMVRDLQAQGDNKDADLLTYDIKAEQERQTYIDQQEAFWGDQITGNQAFQDQLALIDKVHGEERLAIVQKYATAATTALDTTLTQAQGNVTSLFGNLTTYAHSLQTGSDSPLSPTAQYALASSQFDAVAGAAKAGDYNSASQLQTYSQSLVSSARAVYGSGQGYADTVTRVLDAISGTAANADMLTASAQQKLLQDQTAAIVDSQTQVLNAVQDLKAEMTAVRKELQQQARAA